MSIYLVEIYNSETNYKETKKFDSYRNASIWLVKNDFVPKQEKLLNADIKFYKEQQEARIIKTEVSIH